MEQCFFRNAAVVGYVGHVAESVVGDGTPHSGEVVHPGGQGCQEVVVITDVLPANGGQLTDVRRPSTGADHQGFVWPPARPQGDGATIFRCEFMPAQVVDGVVR